MSVTHSILQALNQAGIRYVHFKSNPHLAANFTGDSDFDVLVDARDHAAFRRVLMDHGAKQCEPTRYGIYPGVENWLAFDEDSGVMFHFHLHSRLASGLELYKDYILPWDRLLLDTRALCEEYDCYIADPNVEIVLLLGRMVVKASAKDLLKARLGRLPVPQGMLDELRDLLEKLDPARLPECIEAMFAGEDTRKLVARIAAKRALDLADYRALCGCVRAELRFARRNTPLRARARSFRLKLTRLRDRHAGRFCEYPIRKKIPQTGGMLIAFVGIDGSGKSTASKLSMRWLKKKIEARHAYLGSGAEGDTRYARALRRLASLLSGRGGALRHAREIAQAALYAAVAKRIEREIIRLNRYRLNGGIAVTDRFPQIQMPGVNDGPKLHAKLQSKNPLLRRFARLEQRRYRIVEHIQPDLVIRMNISAETSMKRHPEQLDIQTYQRKIARLQEIRFDRSTLLDIDAEQPLDVVMLEAMRAIWNHI